MKTPGLSKTKKIAIIDDDQAILDALRLTFEMAGFEAKTSLKGEETMRIVRQFHPDVILLDVLLSGLDGRMLCHEIKKNPSTHSIPVIMMSAHPNAEQTVMGVGADAFIAKPFEISELLRLVSNKIR